jgi:exodeoxyribonuclease V gamma subunit
MCSDMKAFAAIIETHVNGKAIAPLMVDMKIEGWTLSGRIDGVNENGLACYRPASLQPKDMLKTWILHLVLNCTRASSSILIGKGSMQMYRPLEDSSMLLKEMLALYWQGLREPLRFFPRSSHAFAKRRFSRMAEEIHRHRRTPNGKKNNVTPISNSHSEMFPSRSILSGKR